jgi:putative SOS response-associated peptidase YedK
MKCRRWVWDFLLPERLPETIGSGLNRDGREANEEEPSPRFASIRGSAARLFAGIWTNWTSVRKLKEGETTNDLSTFLTTEPNTVVAPIHPKAMPVILTTTEEVDV